MYPKELNLYGDWGNIESLIYRCVNRRIGVEVTNIDASTARSEVFKRADIFFMGGGPDSIQKNIFKDFLFSKGPYIKECFLKNKVGLFICGAYQLLGNYYRPYFGEDIKGLGLVDFYTEHFGRDSKRCVGNVVVDISNLNINTSFSRYLVGFENHGGNTFLGPKRPLLGSVKKGFGNNRKDKTEGIHVRNFFGSYLHGPLLPKNPHFSDHLISLALNLKYKDNIKLVPLDDSLELIAHKSALILK